MIITWYDVIWILESKILNISDNGVSKSKAVQKLGYTKKLFWPKKRSKNLDG